MGSAASSRFGLRLDMYERTRKTPPRRRNSMKNKYVLIVGWGLLLFTAGLTEAQTKVKSSYSGTAGFNIPLWIALETEEFRKLDLDVDAILITGGFRGLRSFFWG